MIGRRSCRCPAQEPQSGPAHTDGRPAGAWPITNLARASATGAITLAAVQLIDMRLTGRPSSDTPVRAVEMLIGRPVQGPLLRNVLAYGVQSALAPSAAVAASLAGDKPKRRLEAAFLAPYPNSSGLEARCLDER